MSKTLRDQLHELLRTSGELDAFFTDHFPNVSRRFSEAMSRDEKESLALEAIPAERLQDRLRLAQEYSLALQRGEPQRQRPGNRSDNQGFRLARSAP